MPYRVFKKLYWNDEKNKLQLGGIVFTLVIVSLGVVINLVYNFDIHPDHFLDTPDFIEKYGYPSETHTVQSEDGYLTTLHRIPRGRNDKGHKGQRPAVFVQHGILCSSDSWVYKGPDQDLPFLLADGGFDVWLGNPRGNYYSTGHVNLSVHDEKYWDFSFHEMGYYDIPAAIDYVLKTTNNKQIYYVGYSMGSTMFFVMASTRPEYNKKVKAMAALAPVMVLPKMTSNTEYYMIHASLRIGEVIRALGRYQLYPRSNGRSYVMNWLCREDMPFQSICRELTFGLAGVSPRHYNKTLSSVVYAHIPAGSGDNPIRHFVQTEQSGIFRAMDRGEAENLKRYNSPTPPEYDTSKVTVPVSLFYAENDALATPKGVQQVRKALPNVASVHKIDSTEFNHFDFAWGLEATELLYDKIIQLFQRYQKSDKSA